MACKERNYVQRGGKEETPGRNCQQCERLWKLFLLSYMRRFLFFSSFFLTSHLHWSRIVLLKKKNLTFPLSILLLLDKMCLKGDLNFTSFIIYLMWYLYLSPNYFLVTASVMLKSSFLLLFGFTPFLRPDSRFISITRWIRLVSNFL